MTLTRLFPSVSFERVFKVVVMVGVVITAISFFVIAATITPAPRPTAAQDSDVRWTTGAVRVSPENRERVAERSDAVQPSEPAAEPADSAVAASATGRVATAPAPPAAAPSAEEPAPEPDLPRTVLLSAPEVIDGGTLRADGRLIRLAGIEPLGLEDMCEGSRRRVWRCGQRARAVLRSLVRRGRVTCSPVGGDARTTLARCSVAGKDLSDTLLAQRLAIPLGRATAQNDAFDPPPFYPTGTR